MFLDGMPYNLKDKFNISSLDDLRFVEAYEKIEERSETYLDVFTQVIK